MRSHSSSVLVRVDSKNAGVQGIQPFRRSSILIITCRQAQHSRASGARQNLARSREELEESLREAISLYLEGETEAEVLTSDHVESVEHYGFSEAEGLVPA